MTTNEKMIILYGPGPQGQVCRKCRHCDRKKCKLINAPVIGYGLACGKFEVLEGEK